MSESNLHHAQSGPNAETVRDLWLVDRQQPSPKPMGVWIVEHEELRDEIVSWELLYRHHGADAFAELTALESVFDRPLDITLLSGAEQSGIADGMPTTSLTAAIEATGLKPRDIAAKLQVGTTVLARLLRGQIDPLTAPVTFLISLSQAVNTKVDTLIEMLRTPPLTPEPAMYKRESRSITSAVAERSAEHNASNEIIQASDESGSTQEQHPVATNGNGANTATMTFNDAIAAAPDMTDAEKQQWLSG